MDTVVANMRQPARRQLPGTSLTEKASWRALIALSLANLAFTSAWQRRLYGDQFFSPSWSWVDALGLLLGVLLVGALFYVLLLLAARVHLRSRNLQGLVLCIPLFVVCNVVRRIAFPYHGRAAEIFLIVLPLAVGTAIVCFQRKLLPIAEFAALGLVLLLPVNLFRMTLVAGHHRNPPRLAAKFHSAPAHRVVWMVFDEMDYSLTFPHRPADLRLPQLDALKAQAFFATVAHQPATDTEKAVPSIISGREIEGVPTAQGDHILRVQFAANQPTQDWGASPNVFSDARAAHINVGVVGWYLPYCRIFAPLITDCYWEPIYSGVTDTPALRGSLVDEMDSLTPVESRVRLIQRLQHITQKAESMANDSQLGLVFIHFPVPHAPEIFNRYAGRVTPFSVHKQWFFDNLAIADQTLGAIRDSMQRSGAWDQSTIIVTSDHSLREGMMAHPDPQPLVPFMVKMPGQHEGVVFNTPFETPIVRSLISAILAGEVTASSLPNWMQQHAADGQERPQAAVSVLRTSEAPHFRRK